MPAKVRGERAAALKCVCRLRPARMCVLLFLRAGCLDSAPFMAGSIRIRNVCAAVQRRLLLIKHPVGLLRPLLQPWCCQVMLLDNRCKPVYDLGSGPYNIARWNPFGRFLAIAGFGNLPGEVTW